MDEDEPKAVKRVVPWLLLVVAFLALVAVYVYVYFFWAREPLAWLDTLPGVAGVERAVWPSRPAGTIVHIRDWHLGDDRQRDDDEHLDDVERVQAEQVALLRQLAHRGHRTVGVEGLTGNGLEAWQLKLAVLREQAGDQESIRHMMLEAKRVPGGKGDEVARSAEALARQHRVEVAELGAVARVLLEKVEPEGEVFGLDDEDALEAAAPMMVGKDWVFDPKRLQKRREAIVRNAVAMGMRVVVIVLGASHDLSEAVKQEAPGWAYVRVTTRAVKSLLGE